MSNKLIGLAEAAAMVPDGATISFGGFTTQRHPMAFIHELIRLRRRNLYLFGHSPGGDWDILIGAGCVKRVELAYEADEAFNTIGSRWRLAVERGQIEWEDYSNFAMVSRFTAGAMGIPFMPIRSLLGSDVLTKEVLTPEQRLADPRTASKKLEVMNSPFAPGEKVALVPAIHTEFAVIHVQKASINGVVRIEGQTFADVQQALCADTVIVTAEEIVDEDQLRQEPERNLLPYFAVKHVCHVPYGSHPYAVFKYYDYDPRQLKVYHDGSEDDATFQQYLDKYVYGVKNHAEYLQAIGGEERLSGLKADPVYGYSPNLKRRRLD
ncbi:CoA-transferase [Candidatus Chlorohelix sp.]|uniref:CoA transferase subunit A n=1 Tax=Candidatus Chlorohelix sp. TaxID=3139201 RepID=UPI003061D007